MIRQVRFDGPFLECTSCVKLVDLLSRLRGEISMMVMFLWDSFKICRNVKEVLIGLNVVLYLIISESSVRMAVFALQ